MDRIATPPLQGRHILVAEDDALVGGELADALRDAGAFVHGPFATVAAALSCLEGGARCDGAVLDIDLADESVFPVAQALRERGIPFVFATGHASSPGVPQNLHHVPCWAKPFPADALAATLPSLMRGR
jgi:DNA-binding NtrC family response regulator